MANTIFFRELNENDRFLLQSLTDVINYGILIDVLQKHKENPPEKQIEVVSEALEKMFQSYPDKEKKKAIDYIISIIKTGVVIPSYFIIRVDEKNKPIIPFNITDTYTAIFIAMALYKLGGSDFSAITFDVRVNGVDKTAHAFCLEHGDNTITYTCFFDELIELTKSGILPFIKKDIEKKIKEQEENKNEKRNKK